MATADVSEAEVLRKIREAQHYIKTHESDLPNAWYNFMDGISKTVLAYKDSKGDKDWVSVARNAAGEPIWTKQEASTIAEVLPTIIAQAGGSMQGGAFKVGDLKFTASSKLVSPTTGSSVSLDDMAATIQQYLASLDEKNRELASILGPVAIVNQMKTDPSFGPYLPFVPIRMQVPARLILPGINAVLETCRLLVSQYAFDVPILRKILSFVLAIYDVSRGEWRDGVLSFLGVFSTSYMVYGMIGKTARWVFNFISPDIQQRLGEDMWAGGKSMIIGGWLWLISVASPDFIRNTFNQLLMTAKQPLEELNKKIEAIEKQAQVSAAAIGAQVSFPRLPLDKMPSFDDIQNFQAILHQPEVVCSPAFQQAIQPALAIAPLRLVLELLNVPTDPEKVAAFCKDQPATLAEAVTKALTPTVTLPTSAAAAPTAPEPTTTVVPQEVKQSAGKRATLKRARLRR